MATGTEPRAALAEPAVAASPLDDARARFEGHLANGHTGEARAVLDALGPLGAGEDALLLAEARILAAEGNREGLLRLVGDLDTQPAGIRAPLALLAAQALAAVGSPDAPQQVRAALSAGLAVAPGDVGLLLALARLERAEGHWLPAYRALRAALLAEPQSAAPWLELGELELTRGRPAAALTAFDEALALDPNTVAARLRRVLIRLDRGDYTGADADLQQAQGQAGARVPIVVLEALSATLQGQPEQARLLVDQVLATEPDNAIARYVGAWLELTDGAVEGARRKLTDLRQAHPELAFLHRPYGLLLLKEGDFEVGKALIEDYLLAYPDDFEVLAAVAAVAQAQGRVAEAMALQARGQQARAAVQGRDAARGHLADGDPAAAAAVLAPMLEADPHWRDGRRLLAVARLRGGDEAGAAALAQALIAADPDDAVARQVLGLALAADDPAAARAAFEAAWALAPGEPTLAAQLAELAFARGDLATARAVYEQVLAVNPGHRASLSALASLAGATGDDDGRLAYLREAVRFHPDDGEVRLALARDLLQRGERGPAMVLAGQTPTDDAAGRLVRYRIEAAAGDWQAAAASARALRDLEPASATAWLQLAEAEGRAGRVEALREALVGALARRTDDPASGETLLRLAMLSGGPAEIGATLRLLAERQPENPAVLDAVGLALLADNQTAEAVAHYGAAHRLLPDNPLWTLRQADALRRLGRPAQQLAVLESGAMRFEADARIRVALGDAYAANGRLPAAELAYLGAGDDAAALERLARLTAASDAAAAADYARRASAIDPSPGRLYALGVLALQSGATAEAATVLRRLLRQQPDHADARYHLALALHKQGDDAAARQLLTGLLRSPRTFPMRAAADRLYGELTP